MSFLQSLAKGSTSTSRNSTTQNQNSKIWADRLTSSSSSASASASQAFRSPASKNADAEYSTFIDGPSSAVSHPELPVDGAVGPYSLLDQPDVTFSPDIEFQKSLDGLDVVSLLEVMDTQNVEVDAFAVGRGGEKSEMVDEETEDPVEWLGLSKGEYTEEIWGEGDGKRKGKGKAVEEEEVKEEVKVRKGKGKGKGVDMKSRL
ncbi:hypothetical protein ABW19_dt0209122 [Dactylella cylindrospora]|nr:hypothetical protein ABW19_dt0209122 [Dactylella cylindrospora]